MTPVWTKDFFASRTHRIYYGWHNARGGEFLFDVSFLSASSCSEWKEGRSSNIMLVLQIRVLMEAAAIAWLVAAADGSQMKAYVY